MKKNLLSPTIRLTTLLTVLATTLTSQAATVDIQVDQPGHKVAPTLWGVFFEDINLSADGGIYPEQVRNRSFEDAAKPDFWNFVSTGSGKSEMAIATQRPLNPLNKQHLRVRVDGAFTLENSGYYGMGIAKDESYTFWVAVRGEDFSGPITVKLTMSVIGSSCFCGL